MLQPDVVLNGLFDPRECASEFRGWWVWFLALSHLECAHRIS